MNTTSPIVQPAIMADEWVALLTDAKKMSEMTTHIHIDVMDGILVPPKSFPYNETSFSQGVIPAIHNLEAHLMVQNPEKVGVSFARAGIKRVVAQVEGFQNKYSIFNIQFSNKKKNHEIIDGVRHALRAWREAGADVGLSLLLDTPLTQVTQFLDSGDIDYVQVMSIARIGYQGEEFDKRACTRILKLHEMYPDVTIAVDGGINEKTILSALEAGATIFTVGSGISGTTNPIKAYERLVELVK